MHGQFSNKTPKKGGKDKKPSAGKSKKEKEISATLPEIDDEENSSVVNVEEPIEVVSSPNGPIIETSNDDLIDWMALISDKKTDRQELGLQKVKTVLCNCSNMQFLSSYVESLATDLLAVQKKSKSASLCGLAIDTLAVVILGFGSDTPSLYEICKPSLHKNLTLTVHPLILSRSLIAFSSLLFVCEVTDEDFLEAFNLIEGLMLNNSSPEPVVGAAARAWGLLFMLRRYYRLPSDYPSKMMQQLLQVASRVNGEARLSVIESTASILELMDEQPAFAPEHGTAPARQHFQTLCNESMSERGGSDHGKFREAFKQLAFALSGSANSHHETYSFTQSMTVKAQITLSNWSDVCVYRVMSDILQGAMHHHIFNNPLMENIFSSCLVMSVQTSKEPRAPNRKFRSFDDRRKQKLHNDFLVKTVGEDF